MAVLIIRTVISMVDNFPLGRFQQVFTLQEAAEALVGKTEAALQLEMTS